MDNFLFNYRKLWISSKSDLLYYPNKCGFDETIFNRKIIVFIVH